MLRKYATFAPYLSRQQGHFDFLNLTHTLNQFFDLETFPHV